MLTFSFTIGFLLILIYLLANKVSRFFTEENKTIEYEKLTGVQMFNSYYRPYLVKEFTPVEMSSNNYDSSYSGE